MLDVHILTQLHVRPIMHPEENQFLVLSIISSSLCIPLLTDINYQRVMD